MAVTSRWRLALVAVATIAALGGCSTSTVAPATVVEFPLDQFTPTVLPGHTAVCEPEAVNAVVHASPNDPARVWLVDAASGSRVEIVWPPDYRVRFGPSASILDGTGAVVLHEGDPVTRACHTGNTGFFWLNPPFQGSVGAQDSSSTPPAPQTVSCCSVGPTAWPGGISREQAEQRAIELVPTSGSSTPTVVWAAFDFDPYLPRDASGRKPVWLVRLEGTIAAPTCVPGYLEQVPSTADPLCLDRDSNPGVVVVLDFYDGSLIGWLH